MVGSSLITSDIEKGIVLFNQGRYFEAHEAWEDLWLSETDREKKFFYQGLIMAAGALLHYTRRECVGAGALLAKCIPLLQRGLFLHLDLQLLDLIRDLNGLRGDLDDCRFQIAKESLPKISQKYAYC
jgi:uncharacterized protein